MKNYKEIIKNILESKILIIVLALLTLLFYYTGMNTAPFYVFGIYLALVGVSGAEASAIYILYVMLNAACKEYPYELNGWMITGVIFIAIGSIIYLIPIMKNIKEEYKKLLNPILFAMAATLISMLLSLINTPDMSHSISGIGGYLLAMAFLFIGRMSLSKNEKTIEQLLFSVVVSGLVISVELLVSFISLRMNGEVFLDIIRDKMMHLGWGHVNNCAVFLSIGILAGLYLISRERKLYMNIFYVLAFFIETVFLILTGSRGGYIGLAVSGVMMAGYFIWYSIKHPEVRRKNLILTGTFLTLFAIFLIVVGCLGYLKEFVSLYKERGLADSQRDSIYAIAMEQFKSHWFIGSGVYSSPYYLAQGGRTDVAEYHGYIYQALGCQGILGLSCFIAYIGAMAYRIFKNRRIPYAFYVLCVLLYFLNHGFVDNLFYFTPIEPMIIILVSIL